MFLKRLENLIVVLGIALPISICNADGNFLDSASELDVSTIASDESLIGKKEILEEIPEVQDASDSKIDDENSEEESNNDGLDPSNETPQENNNSEDDDFSLFFDESKEEKYNKEQAKLFEEDACELKASMFTAEARVLNYKRCTEALLKCGAIDAAAEIIKRNYLDGGYLSFDDVLKNFEQVFSELYGFGVSFDGLEILLQEGIVKSGIKHGAKVVMQIDQSGHLNRYLECRSEDGKEILKYGVSFGKDCLVGIYKIEEERIQ